jgi:hypothetical protein
MEPSALIKNPGKWLSMALCAGIAVLSVQCVPKTGGDSSGDVFGILALLGLSPSSPAPKYTVSGTISNLGVGNSVSFQLNGSETQIATTSGSFSFTTELANGAEYSVFVTSNTGTTCMASSNKGTIPSSNVTNVRIDCNAVTYTLSVNVTGLQIVSGNEVVFQNNGTNDLTRSANGTAAFSMPVPSGAYYAVSVKTNPSVRSQVCSPSGTSTAQMTGNTTVNILCSPDYFSISGTTASTNGVQGLAGDGLQVRLNNTMEVLTFNSPPASADITFTQPVANGASYEVVVITQPSNLNQTCSVTNGTGTMAGANITNVKVSCVTNQYTVSGSISGMSSGDSVVLLLNGGSNQTIPQSSPTFSWNVTDGAAYAVTVQTHAAGKTCTVTNGAGTLAGANVTNVSVSCSFNTYTVGGTVTGLCSGQSIQVQNNSGNTQTVNSAGSFNFTFPAQNDLSAYSVTISSGPPSGVSCSLSNASGNLAGANVTNVSIACTGCMSCAGAGQFRAQWTASRSADVASTTGGGHRVYYSTSSGVSTSTTTYFDVPYTTSTTTGLLTGRTTGCTYYVRVQPYSALNPAGASGAALTTEQSVTIP